MDVCYGNTNDFQTHPVERKVLVKQAPKLCSLTVSQASVLSFFHSFSLSKESQLLFFLEILNLKSWISHGF